MPRARPYPRLDWLQVWPRTWHPVMGAASPFLSGFRCDMCHMCGPPLSPMAMTGMQAELRRGGDLVLAAAPEGRAGPARGTARTVGLMVGLMVGLLPASAAGGQTRCLPTGGGEPAPAAAAAGSAARARPGWAASSP